MFFLKSEEIIKSLNKIIASEMFKISYFLNPQKKIMLKNINYPPNVLSFKNNFLHVPSTVYLICEISHFVALVGLWKN